MLARMWKNWNPPASPPVRMQNGAATVENSMVVPQEIQHGITMWSSKPTSSYIPKRTESRDSNRYLYIHVSTSVIHNSHKVETTQVFIKWWKKRTKLWYLLTMQYHSAFKRTEIPPHTTTWVHLEDIMLSETSQTQKDKYCTVPLIRPKILKFIETESSGGCQGLGGRGERRVSIFGVWSFSLRWWKSSGGGRWWCLYNVVNAPHATELYI